MSELSQPIGDIIPDHSILAEASPSSLGELFSRDPEGYSQQDLSQIIAALRAQRARLAEAEAKAGKVKLAKTGNLKAALPAEDMGI